jgi:ATP-dependent Zn protease
MGVGRKNLLVPEKAKLMTAYHEMGHALTALLTKGSQKVSKITILPRGPALGFTAFVPEE